MTYTIYNDLYRLNREMNRALFGGSSRSSYWPETNIYENENEYMVVGKVPGVEKEDISITIKDNSLKISGVKKDLKTEDENEHLKERKNGKFERNFLLNEKIDTEKINAEVKNGIVLIKIPKSPETKPVKIAIK
jgi:HSP20 family protein